MALMPGQAPPNLAAIMGGGAGGAPGGAPQGGSPGGLPPGLMAGAPGAGPMGLPQGNPGNSIAALSKLKAGLGMIQEALPALPMGSELHSAVLSAVEKISKVMPEAGTGGTQDQIAQLVAMIHKTAQQQPNAALQSLAQPAANSSPVLPQASAGGGGSPLPAAA